MPIFLVFLCGTSIKREVKTVLETILVAERGSRKKIMLRNSTTKKKGCDRSDVEDNDAVPVGEH